mmetsp:Transcript_32115/g.102292  ORF Transcript_32115/g.102292 Transcript_32115/m.102292 type:complete len:133 (+) Transcript_32115:2244-2642(+)
MCRSCHVSGNGGSGVYALEGGSVSLESSSVTANRQHGVIAQLGGSVMLRSAEVSGNAQTGLLVRHQGSRIGIEQSKVGDNAIGVAAMDGGVVGKGSGCDVTGNKEAQQLTRTAGRILEQTTQPAVLSRPARS